MPTKTFFIVSTGRNPFITLPVIDLSTPIVSVLSANNFIIKVFMVLSPGLHTRADRSDSDFTFDSILVSWSIWKCLDICNMKSMDLIQSIALSAHWMLFTTLCHVFIISSVSEAKVSTPIISSVYEAKVPRQLFPPQHPVLLSSFHKSFCVSSDGLPLWH